MRGQGIQSPKNGSFILAILVSFVASLLYSIAYLGNAGTSSSLAFASVSKAKLSPPDKNLCSTRRMLGAQVSVFTAQDYQEVEGCLLGLKAAGVNTVIVRAFQHSSDRLHAFAKPQCRAGVYFETHHAPVVDPVFRRIVSMGHRYGLRVFAWLETRNTPLYVSDPQASKARTYSFETGCLEPLPMWSIFDEAVEKRLIGLYEDVARTGIDGILIQDDLIMYHNEDFSAKAVALFEKETGRDLDPEDLYETVFQDAQGRWLVSDYSDTFWAWAQWKNKKLLSLAEKLIGAARSINPEIQVAMNFMYESVTDPKNALAWLSQSLAEADRLPIDYYAIMAYHRQMKKELEISQGATYHVISDMMAKLLGRLDDSHKILMKIQMCDWETHKEIPPGEAHEILKMINSQGPVSLAFMPYSATTPLQIISRHFRG